MYLVIVFRDRQKENSDILLNVGIPALFPMSYRCFPAAKIVIVFRPGNFFKLKKIKAGAVLIENGEFRMDNYDYLEGCLPTKQIIIFHSPFSTLN